MGSAVHQLCWWLRLRLVRVRGWLLRRDERRAIIALGFEAAQRRDYTAFFLAMNLIGGPEGSDAQTLATVALPYYDAGRTSDAASFLATALQEAPDDPLVLMCYGRYLNNEGRYAEAVQYLTRSLGCRPNDPWILGWLGSSHLGLGNLEQAREYYARSIRQGTEDADVASIYSGLAHTAARLEDWPEAARCWCEAAKRLPKDEEIWHNLGDALLQVGKYREAIRALKKSLRLGTGEPAWTYYDLARCHQQLGDTSRAKVFCEKALQHAPDDADALKLRKELNA